MARSKLGNDPFRRGAASPDSPRPVEAPKEAPAAKVTRKQRRAAARELAMHETAPEAAEAAEAVAPALEPAVESPGEPVIEVAPEPVVEPVIEPAVEAVEPAPSPRSVAHEVSDVITSETLPLPPRPGEVSPAITPGETDAFGRDPAFAERALRLLEPVYRHYFRVEARGVENVPADGPVILVANHSGAVPWDVAMLAASTALDHPSRRVLRPLVEDFVFHFPFVGTAFNRLGAVRACQENAEALLAAGEAVAVFPEGAKGLGKSYRKRYQLQRFGRGGFVKLALRTGAPVVPVAIVGAEETHPVLARLVRPAAPLGLPFLPVTPTFPWLGALGLLPLPTKWTIEFGSPVRLDARPDADELVIGRLTEEIRAAIQGQLDRLLRGRRGIFT